MVPVPDQQEALQTEAVVMAPDQREVQVTAVVLVVMVLAMELLPELTELTGEQLTVPDQREVQVELTGEQLTVLALDQREALQTEAVVMAQVLAQGQHQKTQFSPAAKFCSIAACQ